ncbi:MAG: LysR family transcriptional regulator [Siculibacillus sp.]
MDLADLRLVRAVLEGGGVSRAAERLNCVQSNVTARLRRLEDDLGGPLFHRTPRGVTPTPAGRVLADYAARVLALADEARRATAAALAGAGPLSLGAMETATAVRLPPVLARFHAEHPAVELTLATGTSDEILAAVLDRRHDLGLVAVPVDHPDLLAEEAFVEELVLVHDGRRTGAAPLLAFRSGCSYRRRAEQWLAETGRAPTRVMELGTLDGILGCVAAGMGRAVLPRAVVERADVDPALRFEPLGHPLARVPVHLVRRRDAPDMPARDAFARLLRAMSAAPPAHPAVDVLARAG